MIARFFRKARTHLRIAFDDRYTLEGFERTRKKFETPENFSLLDPRTKRDLTICNLFANKNQSLWDIASLLDDSINKVVATLIENGLIKERRVRAERIRHERRHKALQAHSMATHPIESTHLQLPFSMYKRSSTEQVSNEVASNSVGSPGRAN
jgi:hypothetical protein